MRFSWRPVPTLLSLALAGTLGACAGDDPAATTDGTATSSTSGATDGTSGTDGGTDSGSGTVGDTDGCGGVQIAIVTDIDETLTISDAEYIMQLQDGTYEPVGRDGGPELISGYAALGYHIIYLTARAEDAVLMGTDEPSRDATQRWLMENGYPVGARTELIMSPNFVFGGTAQEYKTEALMGKTAEGFTLEYAYGNASSDIGAYAANMIALDKTFIIGDNAGEGGTVAIMGEAWTDHAATQLPMVPMVCDPEAL